MKIWLTIKQIKDIDPFDASIAHWEQMKEARPEAFYNAMKSRLVNTDHEWCGLCRMIKKKYNSLACCCCPLEVKCNEIGSPWQAVSSYMDLDITERCPQWRDETMLAFDAMIYSIKKAKERNMIIPNLKPCPLCECEGKVCVGGFGPVNKKLLLDFIDVTCTRCGLTVFGRTREEAISKWNTRPTEDRLKAANEELKIEISLLRRHSRAN